MSGTTAIPERVEEPIGFGPRGQDPAASAPDWKRRSREAAHQGDIAAATDFARSAVAAEPDEPARHAELGRLLVWGGAYDEAARVASELIADPHATELGERLMLDLLRMRGRTDEMAAHWRTLDRRQRARVRENPLGRRGFRFLDHEHGVLHRIGEAATQLDTLVGSSKNPRFGRG